MNPFVLDVAMMVMLTSLPSNPIGTVPIRDGGGVGLFLIQSTGGLVVNSTES